MSAEAAPEAVAHLEVHDVLDVAVRLSVEVGRARLPVADVVGVQPGAIVDLDREPDDPVDVYVNGLHYGTGRLVLVGDEWAVRLETIGDAGGTTGARAATASPDVEQASSAG